MVRIVYFGTPVFAVPTLERLLASSHEVVAIVTQPDRPRGRGQRVSESPVKGVARAHGIPVVQPAALKDPAFLERLTAFESDLGVVAAYGRILPDAVLRAPRLGIINVHASLLPKYRGAAPIHRAIMAGETETGITIIRLVREMDAGPMLKRRARPVGPDETSDEVERDLAAIGADLLLESVDDLEAGRAREEEQDHTRATFAPRLTKDEGVIDWTAPAGAVHNRVRGLHPWPLAHTFLDGSRLVVLRTSLLRADETAPWRQAAQGATPGRILCARGDDLVVAVGAGGAIAVREIQPEGRRRLSVREFLAGHPLAAGSVFRAAPSP